MYKENYSLSFVDIPIQITRSDLLNDMRYLFIDSLPNDIGYQISCRVVPTGRTKTSNKSLRISGQVHRQTRSRLPHIHGFPSLRWRIDRFI